MSRSLQCPRPGCSGKLSYVNAKTNSDRSVRVWRRSCPVCGAQVTDTGVFSREIRLPGTREDGVFGI